MPNRLIKNRNNNTSSLQLMNCFSSLIALELLYPSAEMYLISPWITNVPVLSNNYGQFRSLLFNTGRETLGLKDVLVLLSERQCKVYVMTSQDKHNLPFLENLPQNIKVKRLLDLHEKGWVSGHFYLRGSMNFTYSGININRESVEITTDENDVSLAMLEARQYWENS